MIEWSDTLRIGVEFIDEEHKDIIESYQKLYLMMRDGKGHEYYKELLQFLDRYVTDHFNHEEAVQNESNYPDAEKHKAIHETFKLKIKDVIESHDEETTTNKELITINLYLKNWLLNHILKVDVLFGKYYLSLDDR